MATVASVRRRLDESVERFWSDTELQDWLDEGAAEIARRTETLQTIAGIPVTAGDSEFNMPADLLRAHVVLWQTRSGFFRQLRFQDLNRFPLWQTTGDPLHFTIWGFPPVMRVWPTPSRDSLIYVLYYATGESIPVGWDDVLLDYCEYRALRKDNDPRWTDARALFENKVSAMIDNTQRWTDQAGSVLDQEYVEFPFDPIFVANGGAWDVDAWDDGVWG